MKTDEKIAGDKKVGKALLWDLEQKFIAKCLPKIPNWISSYHLTLATLIWSFFSLVPSPFRGGARGGVYGCCSLPNTPSFILPLKGGGTPKGKIL